MAFVQVMTGGVTAVATSSSHTIVLKQDGSAWCTGDNEYGQLGDGSTQSQMNFVKVIEADVVGAAAGREHSAVRNHNPMCLALKSLP